MFTGIITDVGSVKTVEARGDTRFEILTAYDLGSVDIGASIACDGVCLTVVSKSQDGAFSVDVSAESLSKTTLGAWAVGRKVNLERALKVGDELGGHIVSGHVDCVGKVLSITPEGDSQRWTFCVPKAFAGYIAPKGSIALNGASLTVNEVEDTPDACIFGINLIPHTQSETSFSGIKAGDSVNVEIDTLARYVARLKDVS